MSQIFPSKKFVRVWSGEYKDAKMVPEGEVSQYENPNYQDLYGSLSYYSKEHEAEFKKSGSVKGITGLKTDKIWFDLDMKEDLESCKKSTIQLVDTIVYKGYSQDSLEIYFSGQKGFHVIMNLDQEIPTTKVKDIAMKFGKDIPGFDLTVYDEARILRLPFTRHSKTGLYKIPVSYEDLRDLSIDQIKTKASSVPEVKKENRKKVKLTDDLMKVEVPQKKETVSSLLEIRKDDPLLFSALDFTRKPRDWKSDAKWALSQGRFAIGDRHKVMMILGATCKALHYNELQTRGWLEAANQLHCDITGDKVDTDEIDKTIEAVFDESWKGGQYSRKSDAWLDNYCVVNGLDDDKNEDSPISISDISESFKHFVVNIDKNTIKTGIKELDDAIPITIGMNLGIIGAASSGKTAMSLEILRNTSMNGVVSVIASLDMHRNRLFEKLLYKVSNDVYGTPLTRHELYELFKNNREEKLLEEIKKQYGNVYFYDRSRPTVEDISNFVKIVEKQTTKKVKLIMIDYFERISSDITDATASSLRVANELQDLINDLNVALITLVQPNKMSLAGGPDSAILSYTSIKGSSFLYQAFRGIISIWRPFFTPDTKDDDKFLEMAILKNDLGELDKFKFNWDGKTGSIFPMTQDDELRYAECMDRKRENMQQNAGNGNGATPFDSFIRRGT